MEFRTHTGEIITGERLQEALDAVADDWAELGHAIRAEDAYASHVEEHEKEEILTGMLAAADSIRAGDIESFTIWQRVNEKITAECPPLLGM